MEINLVLCQQSLSAGKTGDCCRRCVVWVTGDAPTTMLREIKEHQSHGRVHSDKCRKAMNENVNLDEFIHFTCGINCSLFIPFLSYGAVTVIEEHL